MVSWAGRSTARAGYKQQMHSAGPVHPQAGQRIAKAKQTQAGHKPNSLQCFPDLRAALPGCSGPKRRDQPEEKQDEPQRCCVYQGAQRRMKCTTTRPRKTSGQESHNEQSAKEGPAAYGPFQRRLSCHTGIPDPRLLLLLRQLFLERKLGLAVPWWIEFWTVHAVSVSTRSSAYTVPACAPGRRWSCAAARRARGRSAQPGRVPRRRKASS